MPVARSRLPAIVLAISTLAASAGGAGTAAAEPKNAGAALKASGDALMREKRYGEALAAYEAAEKTLPDPALHYNRGRALQFLGRYPESLAALRRFQAEAPASVRAKVPTLDDIIAEVRARVALLGLRCEIPGARVLLSRREIGLTPFAKPPAVNAGHATLEILADGYEPFSAEIDLAGDEATTEFVAKLVPRNKVGVLVIKSGVPGTLAQVDDRAIGLVPAEATIQAGDHAVTVSHDGYGPLRTRVVVMAGERKELVLDPITPTPLYKRWWLWTAVGVAAAGAAATIIAIKVEKPAPVGTFSPGLVRF